MPLIAANLQNGLRQLFDSPASTEAVAINGWVNAIQTYTLPIVPPSTTVTLAAQSLRGGLVGFSQTSAALSKLPTAMATFAGIVATGMVPTGPPGTPAVPPVIPLVIPFVNTANSAQAAQVIAQAIDTWMRTGIGPATALSPWS
jgi:hypothetical protein